MSKSIALLVGGVTHTFTYDRTSSVNEEIFTVKTGPLVGRCRLRARLAPNAAGTVNRIRCILEVPKVVDGDAITAGTQPKVAFTQVWSEDVSVVTFSDTADRELLHGLKVALVSHADFKAMIVDGTNLSS